MAIAIFIWGFYCKVIDKNNSFRVLYLRLVCYMKLTYIVITCNCYTDYPHSRIPTEPHYTTHYYSQFPPSLDHLHTLNGTVPS